MNSSLRGVELAKAAREAVMEIRDWIVNPEKVDTPSRAQLAAAVRLSAELLAQDAPGKTVEVRIPPFSAVQCVPGPIHRRGTPPNVVQASPLAWLRAVTGMASLADLAAEDQTRPKHPAHKITVELSGTRAKEVEGFLPLLPTH